ncbi:DUF6631 family protein [Marilutibacter alkalisoli]|uniref:Uncharacterized protein n=1 Tax=Marilutibacter alkalisoli TaxID=2591633 RepID=A0A514BTV5_9GAMM|nr:DUF6631 family protein [Lysobacter alkalisoli]QDH70844.1 hypothetical protein FKV23_12695 [Lysobacter alkalisoli]
MARKVNPDPIGQPIHKPSAVDKTADELQVLKPDITLTLGGESITVHEYDFWTSMDIVYGQRGFLDDAVELLTNTSGEFRDAWEAIRSLFGRHAAYLKRAVAVAVERDVAWVESLGPRETDALLSTWWAVNGHFFLHEATVVIQGRLTRMRLAGSTSSSSSPAPDSETPTASADTPNDS